MLHANHASNAIAAIVAGNMPCAKIKPYSDYGAVTNPLFLLNRNNGLQARKSGSSIPLNVLGGYRWPNSLAVDSELLRKVVRAEIKTRSVPRADSPMRYFPEAAE